MVRKQKEKTGITERLIKISKSFYPYQVSKKYFYFNLDEECKSLKLVKKKIYNPETKLSDDDLFF